MNIMGISTGARLEALKLQLETLPSDIEDTNCLILYRYLRTHNLNWRLCRTPLSRPKCLPIDVDKILDARAIARMKFWLFKNSLTWIISQQYVGRIVERKLIRWETPIKLFFVRYRIFFNSEQFARNYSSIRAWEKKEENAKLMIIL